MNNFNLIGLEDYVRLHIKWKLEHFHRDFGYNNISAKNIAEELKEYYDEWDLTMREIIEIKEALNMAQSVK